MFKVGDRILYPMYGAGIIKEIVEKDFLGESRMYYNVDLPYCRMEASVPVDNCEKLGVRAIIDPGRIDEVITVLKGAGTIIASPDGRIMENHTGNCGMATGGSGDVLAGVTGALLSQGAEPFEAAAAAVYLHGLAGDLAAREKGKISLLPTDIIDYLPQAFIHCGV